MERIKLNIQKFAEDGKVIIKAEMDTSGVDSGIKKIKKEIEDFERYDAISPYDIDAKDLDQVRKRLKEMSDRYEKIKEQNEEIEDILSEVREHIRDAVKNGTYETEEFSKQLKLLMQKNDITWDYYKALTEIENKNNKILETQTKNYEILRKNASLKASESGNAGAMSGIPMNIEGKESASSSSGSNSAMAVSSILTNVAQVGKSVLKVVGKIVWSVLKIGASIAGITLGASFLATIVASLVKAITKILEENKQLMANIKYIVFMVSKMIDNIANAITGKIGGALQGIANIVYTIVVLFGKLLSWLFKIDVFAGITGEAFQEWNRNISGASAGLESAVGSAKELNKQLAGFDEMNVLQEPSSGGGAGGGGGVGVDLPMPDFSDITDIEEPWWMTWLLDNGPTVAGILAGIGTALGLIQLGCDGITASGIGLLVSGLVISIGSLLEYLNDPSWENFGDTIKGIGIAIAGLGVLIGSLPAVVVGAILAIVGIIVKYWEDIKKFLEEKLQWIRNKGDELYHNGTNFIQRFIGFFLQMFGELFEWIIKTIDNLITTWKRQFDGMIQFIKGVFTGDWKKAWDGVKQVISALVDNIIKLFQNTLNLILNYFSRIGTAIGDVIGGSFKKVINSVLDWVQNKINSFIRAINKVIDKVNDIPGISITRLSEVSLPRMAKGGIINQPGRGVPVGMAGEAGREGILPLTDAKAMQLLGQEIGKWITINANITNTMNGRVISRELQKINNENDFAFNS